MGETNTNNKSINAIIRRAAKLRSTADTTNQLKKLYTLEMSNLTHRENGEKKTMPF